MLTIGFALTNIDFNYIEYKYKFCKWICAIFKFEKYTRRMAILIT